MDKRQLELKQWIPQSFQQLGWGLDSCWRLLPVSGDASFRRYFRVITDGGSWIAVDAPPDKEDSHPFVAIARAWESLAIHSPHVHSVDFEQGFMLLSDLGDELYLDHLDEGTADGLYGLALDALLHIQQCQSINGQPFPPYDRSLLQREMELFRDWFIEQLLSIKLSLAEQTVVDEAFEQLIQSALAQPQVCVHRDFHSRNLMVTGKNSPGVIDFQDAVWGPVSYDLVSLLRDCYIDWPKSRVQAWALRYFERATEAGIFEQQSQDCLLRWFDLMGMQRHLKAVGIFARLNIRDDKPDYLDDIPRTLSYLVDISGDYPEFAEFNGLLCQKLLPAMAASEYFPAAVLESLA
ncbi:MAG: phosphotransferase [Motiliproteus sp.]